MNYSNLEYEIFSRQFILKNFNETNILKLKNFKVCIIGVGGFDSGNAAFEKIAAGASAIQLYTGMIYKGPMIVKEIKKGLIIKLNEKGFKNISEAVGSNSN